jgi:hypothetical protein
MHWTRYQRKPSSDPISLVVALMWFLGALANLVAAAVSFFH